MADEQEQKSKSKPKAKKTAAKKTTQSRATTTPSRKKPATGKKKGAAAAVEARVLPPEAIPVPPESSEPSPAMDPPSIAPEPPLLWQAPFEETRQTAPPEFPDDESDFIAGLWPEEPTAKPTPVARAPEPTPKREERPRREDRENIAPSRQQVPARDDPAEPAMEESDSAMTESNFEEGLAPEPPAGQAAPESLPPEGQNGERRRRRRRGRRGRGRGREQEANGQPAAQQMGQPREQREPRQQHGQRDQRGQQDLPIQPIQQPNQRAQQQPNNQHDRNQPRPPRDRRDERGPRDRQDRRDGPNRRDSRDRRDAGDRRPVPQRQPAVVEPIEEAPDLQAAGERTMLINVAEGEECRIAILHQNRLEELFMERASTGSHVGNIYKGRVTNVEPSIQAAFIDFGMPKNGFLHISDLQPQYFPDGMRQVEEVGRKTPRRERPPIQRCLRRGQEVLVQIIKEGIGTKGPTLTTYISIPGRFLVMLPGMNRLGVSRKIEDEDLRRKMRRILDELELPKDMGFILRTAGTDSAKRELQRDLQYLQRLWKVVANRIKNERAPCELYQESDLVIRTVRDVFSADFGKIIVDDEATAEKIRDFISIVMPRGTSLVEHYQGPEPLFHKYRIEEEIERINARHVPLASGGSLVIDSTEALVAIDVNSGRFRDLEDAEETAYRINIEAAEEIARQLRLRDLGGLIVCDLIDMRMDKHRRAVERALRDALKKHKERAKCLRMSQFGIIEMTRQRMRPSIKRSIYQDCPHCRGSGLVKNPESMTLDIMRLLRLTAHKDQVQVVEVRVAPTVAHQLLNRKRDTIHALEQQSGRRIIIRSDNNLGLDQYLFECLDARGGIVETLEPPVDAKADPRAKRNALPPPDAGREGREARESYEDVFD